MRRPHWRSATFTAVTGAMGLAILAGCATRHSGLYARDETARYLHSARGHYLIPGPPSDPWGPYIHEASARFDMPETWIRALMRQESGGSLYRNGSLITSSAGAMGLMQVMPGTYAELRARHNLGPDPFDPHDNIMAGVGYMREMYDMYGSPGFLAAYNAGPNRLDDYLANQRALPDETRHYVAVIGPSLRYAAPRVHSPAEQYAMNQLPLNIPPGPRYGYGSSVPGVQLASAAPFTQFAAQPVYTPPTQPRLVSWDSPRPAPVAAPQPPALAWVQPRPSVITPAPVAQPPALAWNQPPRAVPVAPVSVPTPQAPQPPALAWNEPARPTYAQPVRVPTYAPPQRIEVARAEPPDEEEEAPVRRSHAQPARAQAYAPPQRTVVARAEPRDEYEAPVRRSHAFGHTASTSRYALAIPPVPPQRSGGGLHLISGAMAAEVYTSHHGHKLQTTPVSFSKAEHVHGRPATTWKLHASGPVQAAPACHKNSHGKLTCA